MMNNKSRPKPNLRQLSPSRSKKCILAGCILATLWMYPMIFRPMFGGGGDTLDENQLEETMKELRKHRPGYMPDWSSPFGPKGGEK